MTDYTITKNTQYKIARPATITVRIYASVDGTVEHYQDNLDFTVLRAAAGNGANSTAVTDNCVINASSTSNKFIKLERQVFCFDTSVIGSGSEITSATLSIHNGSSPQNTLGGTPSICITGGTLASHTALASGDYDGFTDNEYATRKLISSYAYNTRYSYTLNAAGLAYISKTDHTVFFFRNSWDVDNSFGGTWASTAYCQVNTAMTENGDSTRPYLDVTYRTSPLNITKNAQYVVGASTPYTITKDTSYKVATSNSTTKSTVYKVLTTQSVTKNCQYAISEATADYTKEVTVSYAVATSGSIEVDASYAIATTDTKEVSASYTVASTDIKQKDVTYSVLTSNEITKDTQYKIQKTYTVEKDASYTLAAFALDAVQMDDDIQVSWS